MLGITLEHAARAVIVAGQGLAPANCLRAASRIEGDVWIVTAADLPCLPDEQRGILEELASGRGLEMFLHTRCVAARVEGEWRPELGAEYRLAFELSEAVPLYAGARFGLRYEGLTVGVGFVEDRSAKASE